MVSQAVTNVAAHQYVYNDLFDSQINKQNAGTNKIVKFFIGRWCLFV